MRLRLALTFFCFILFQIPQVHSQSSETDITTFILVRHAEKVDDSRDPDLSPEGYDRAERLATILTKAELDAIYSTDLTRTKETVRQVSVNKEVDITFYDFQSPEETANEWIDKHFGKVVLISGHSNTTPVFANAILGREYFSGSFDETDYGNLLIITLTEAGDSKLLHLRY